MGDCGRLAATGHAELGEDVGDVEAGRLLGDEQRLADLPVRPPLGDEGEDLGLARGKAKRFGLRMGCLGFGGGMGRLCELQAAALGEPLGLAPQRRRSQPDGGLVGGPDRLFSLRP